MLRAILGERGCLFLSGGTAAATVGEAYLSREDVRDPPQLPRDLVQAFHAHVGVRPRHRRVVNL